MSSVDFYSKQQIDSNVGTSDDTASSSGTLWARLKNLVTRMTTAETNISNKQDTLVSATNIKTINGSSILGSGNLVVSGSGASDSVLFCPQPFSFYGLDNSSSTSTFKRVTMNSSGIVPHYTGSIVDDSSSRTLYSIGSSLNNVEAMLASMQITGTPTGTYNVVPVFKGNVVSCSGSAFSNVQITSENTRYFEGTVTPMSVTLTDGVITSYSAGSWTQYISVTPYNKIVVGTIYFVVISS